jgi:hypothetical protein
MRELYKYLSESLLGDFGDVQSKLDKGAYAAALEKNSDFIKQITNPDRSTRSRLTRFISYNPTFSYFDGKDLVLDCSTCIISKNVPSIPTFFSGVNNLYVSGAVEFNEIHDITPDIATSNIYAKAIRLYGVKHVSDINFNVVNSVYKVADPSIGRNVISKFLISDNMFDSKPTFKNVTINFDLMGGNSTTSGSTSNIVSVGRLLTKFNGVKSNAEILTYHDTFMFDDFDKDEVGFDNLFDWDYVCPIYDYKKKEVVERKIKNLKTLIATANNPKRYYVLDFPCKFKKGSSLT